MGHAIAEAVGRVPPRDRDRVDRETGGKNPGALCARIEPQDVRREPDRSAVTVERLVADRKPHALPLSANPIRPRTLFYVVAPYRRIGSPLIRYNGRWLAAENIRLAMIDVS